MRGRARSRATAGGAVVLLLAALVPGSGAAADGPHDKPAGRAAAKPVVPTGFQDRLAIGNLSEPTAVAFAPDGTAFIALKTGVIKAFEYDAATAEYEAFANHNDFADLARNVHNYWDRGLTGITVDPQFPTRPYLYVNYAYNRDPRDDPPVVPKWGDPAQQYDDCPTPASMGPPVVAGCLVNVRISRLTAVRGGGGWVMSAETPLLEGACIQFPSHASGDVRIGPDGLLYASAGDGASFGIEDYGQGGNPCPGDPVNEGGSLRSQDIRSSGDGLSFSGSIVRMNPDSGLAPDGSNDMTTRIVTYGQRNPWRFTFRPGTSQLFSGDVGGSSWEEINRTVTAEPTTPVNLGWPCYEGSPSGPARHAGWDALDLPLCESLYDAGAGATRTPYFAYPTRGPLLTPGEDCQNSTSSISGIAFVPTSSSYPAAYRGSLLFSDYARGCIWRLGKLGNGDPDPSAVFPFVQSAGTPVDLVTGPGGDLFYVDYGLDDEGVPVPQAGGIRRVVYTPGNQAPTAVLGADKTSGPAPLTVNFDGTGSSDPDGDTLTYEWDLDGDGQYDDSTAAKPSRIFPTGTVTVGLRVRDGRGGVGVDSQQIQAGNTPPALGTVTPSSTLTWAVGDPISFAATATDAQQTLPDNAYSWNLTIRHCPGGVCHTHGIQTWAGQRTGSFNAPDHEYPSHLLLTVNVTDSEGLSDGRTVQLNPKSVAAQFATSPSGIPLTVAGAEHVTPFSQTFIVGSRFNVAAPLRYQDGDRSWTFAGWSDGGAATHQIVAPASASTYTANFQPVTAPLTVRTQRPGLELVVAGVRRKASWAGQFPVGTSVRVVAPRRQSKGGHRYVFVRWSDGGARKHTVGILDAGVALRAVYRRAP